MERAWSAAFLVLLGCSRCGLGWGPEGTFLSAAGPLTTDSRPRDACPRPLPALLPRHLGSLRARGVTHYKVFLSWARLLPAGSSAAPDAESVRCYRRLLGAVRAAGLRPLGVLHRGRLPRAGPGAPAAAAAARFARYAALAFRSFGDLVDVWFTFSDLQEVIPGLPRQQSGPARLQPLVDAHRKAYAIYHEKYAPPGESTPPHAAPRPASPCPLCAGRGAPSHSSVVPSFHSSETSPLG